ncbi:uncharacterized protein LOC125774382 [Anopheles funestus]|uniref:uncharacterized protein LOC125774382 n=1 Tax=Anopheles funestus TaxID=62324 RepID=UPI0020C60FA3|nr:uncharacterized protein LOC125774382 [Anopheles funestus]
MDKKIKTAQHQKLIALENIKSLERFTQAFSSDDASQIPEALEGLEQYKQEFFTAVAKLEECDDSSEAIQSCINDRIDMEERCRRLKSFLRENQRKDANPLNESTLLANSTLAFGRPNAPNLRLPKIELPTFDGDSTKWLSFRDRFVAMIDASPDLPHIAKLQYLLSSLKGDAAVPFEHVALTTENYAVTWASLLKRYDNTRMLIRDYWRKLHFLPGIEAESVDGLTSLVDEFTRHVNGLVKLQEPVDSWDTPLSNMLLMKMDNETILAWEKHSVQFKRDKYSELIEFLQDRVQILKSSKSFACAKIAPTKVAGAHRLPASRKSITSAAAMQKNASISTSPQLQRCPLQCPEPHLLRNCPEFINKEIQQRRDIVKTKGLCWNCLSSSHQVKSCRSDYSCRSCRERHHSLLHHASHSSVTVQPKVTLAAQSDDEMVFLETAMVYIVDDYGVKHEARALLDSGSMLNFISESLAQKLLTPRTKVNVCVTGIGSARQQVKGSITASVRSKDLHFTTPMEFFILDTPTYHSLPTKPVDVSSWDMPNVTLADPTYHVPGKVDLIIGSDPFWEVHTGRKRSLGAGKPWLVETRFGWAVSGNTVQSSPAPRVCHVATSECPLEAIMTRFWESETISDEPALSVEEDICENHFIANTTRDGSGRYVVSLPHKSNPNIILGASRQIADRRLLAVERRLKANPEMREAYSSFMREYENLGHMRRLEEPIDESCPHYYLPHHAVVKESSTSTKVRVVFDASCKTTSGYSLNDSLLVGPVVQQDLYTIMLRFRSHAIALTADVEKMYRQIRHHPPDKNFLRIRYRKDPSEPIATFELQTVTYGTASAPFLATRTLKQIAYDHQEQYPRAVVPVLRDFYVDDLLTGTDEISDAIEMQKQISSMLQSAGFALKKWASNNPKALHGIPQEDLALQTCHEWNKSQFVSTLGLIWEPAADVIRFRIELPPSASVLTKRLVLSYIARIFDILGVLGPTIVIAKLFMQQLWSLKENGVALDWDSELPLHLQQEWNRFHSSLHSLRELHIPRFVSLQNATTTQLHVFADASQAAYGACCYFRAENHHGISVNLLTAKSKVVSLTNTHSIARLELCAARLAIQLVKRISTSLNTPIIIFCWTHSMTVLYWLKSPPRRWKPFVANRVAQIQQETRIKCWRHVPGVDNPADDISRGLLPDKLLSSHRWWHGPHWLSSKEADWPHNPTTEEIVCNDEERATQLVAATSTTNDFGSKYFARFSGYLKLLRTTAYVLRYLRCLKDSVSSVTAVSRKNTTVAELIALISALSKDELHRAEMCLCKLAQQDSFPEDLHAIWSGNEIPRHSRLKWLSPFIDHDGILRVGGRLRNAQITDATKHPIVLSSKHPLASLLVCWYHRKLLHAGPQLLLASLRQRF